VSRARGRGLALVGVCALVLLGAAVAALAVTGRDDGPASAGERTTLPAAEFGAVGDGVANDTQALQRAFDALRPGQVLRLERGRTYLHDEVLTLRRPDTGLTGGGVLLAAEEERSALVVAADGVVVEDVVLRVSETTRRWSGVDQHRLRIGPSTGVVVDSVRIEGSAAAGVFVHGARSFWLDDVVVGGTRADGVHITGGSRDGVVRRPLVEDSGDDGVAVVSYDRDDDVVRDILVEAPVVRRTTGGRGVSVVGGEDIELRDVLVERSSAAGVYVAAEGDPFDTRSTKRVVVRDVRVLGANADEDVDHGAVLVYNGRSDATVEDVRIEDVVVEGTRADVTRQVGVLGRPDSVRGVVLRRFDVPDEGRALEVTTGGGVETDGWTVGGTAVDDPGRR
jgi:hypothetical protein